MEKNDHFSKTPPPPSKMESDHSVKLHWKYWDHGKNMHAPFDPPPPPPSPLWHYFPFRSDIELYLRSLTSKRFKYKYTAMILAICSNWVSVCSNIKVTLQSEFIYCLSSHHKLAMMDILRPNRPQYPNSHEVISQKKAWWYYVMQCDRLLLPKAPAILLKRKLWVTNNSFHANVN